MSQKTYTVRLIALLCNLAQEVNGDEIFMKVNGETIFNWEDIKLRFSEDISKKGRINGFNFRDCTASTEHGWVKVDTYQPEQFIFTNVNEGPEIELWESDKGRLIPSDDDLLGTLKIGAQEANVDAEITVPFVEKGGNYSLKFTVTWDE